MRKMGGNIHIDYGVYFKCPKKTFTRNKTLNSRGSKTLLSYNNIYTTSNTLFSCAVYNYYYLNLLESGMNFVNVNTLTGAKSTVVQGIAIIAPQDIDYFVIVTDLPIKLIERRTINVTN